MPTRFLHDCRRTAARNLIRASVPERVAMLLTGHKTRAIFDRYNIIHEQELLEAGDQEVLHPRDRVGQTSGATQRCLILESARELGIRDAQGLAATGGRRHDYSQTMPSLSASRM